MSGLRAYAEKRAQMRGSARTESKQAAGSEARAVRGGVCTAPRADHPSTPMPLYNLLRFCRGARLFGWKLSLDADL